MTTSRPRVLMILQGFPTVSQTYMMSEVEALQADYELRVVSSRMPDRPALRHPPFDLVDGRERMLEIIREFRPHVLHTHYLHMAPLLAELGEKTGVPFTVRTHSFDTIKQPRRLPLRVQRFSPVVHAVNADICLGALVFPFARPLMESIGIRGHKLIDCYPVVNFKRFYDDSPNGDAVLNVGACLAKKRMEDFVELGRLTDRECNLYPIGYATEKLARYNREHGSPINIAETVQPDEMPAVYKRHGWLVYTACARLKTVGWPMAVAEAQAAGLGICMPNIRPDIAEYVGGAGFLYDDIREVPRILSQPYPEEMRARGFEQARKSDIDVHKRVLARLWDDAIVTPPTIRRWRSFSTYRQLIAPVRGMARFLKRDDSVARD